MLLKNDIFTPVISRAVGRCALAIPAAGAHAQSSRSAYADVGVVNSAISGYIGGLNGNGSDTGEPVSAAATQSFMGMDRNSLSQTMTFTGSVTASAQYGQLHSSATGIVNNSHACPRSQRR